MKRTHYEVLEVCPRATLPTVRAAYKSLIQRHHPDRNDGDPAALTRTQALTRAYEVLADAECRAAYDASLAINRAEMAPRSPGSGWTFPGIRDAGFGGLHQKPSTTRILREFSGVMRASEFSGRGEILHCQV